MISLRQYCLTGIILKHIAKYTDIKVLFLYGLTGVQESDKEIAALFMTPEGGEVPNGGLSSLIRWRRQRSTTLHRIWITILENEAGWKFGPLIADPKYGAVIFRTGAEDTLWRITYGELFHLDFQRGQSCSVFLRNTTTF